ncbi:MAG TPA: DUF6788 family protein [Kofleriaceae bacterium]|jgi:hypothetical protein|nr:DUF6788 family protein [Terracidiphilus sp.]HWU89328.1 DUF6788 family protein [Kofleriaceae bacterium]
MWSATKDGRQQQRGSVFEKKRLTRNDDLVSSFSMIRDQLIETRQRLIAQLPVTGEILRGSLFERTVRHTRGCTICAGGGGHPLWVLSVGYAGGRTRQFSLRREQVDEVRGWLGNYHQLREALEAICELNHALLRPDDAAPRRARQTGD